jgi:hypothetical protein
MKTTIDLPAELVREAKLRAVVQGRALKDLMAEFIRQGLGHPTLPPQAAVGSSQFLTLLPDGLPQIRCRADAPASRASLQALLALEQHALAEDDLRHAGHPV